ncbi:MAG: hypothetical protein ACXU95_01925, partial [Isosphaeraceae bacterium]
DDDAIALDRSWGLNLSALLEVQQLGAGGDGNPAKHEYGCDHQSSRAAGKLLQPERHHLLYDLLDQ